jgi:ATP-dependent helicase/nuclease subunit A
MKLVDGLQRKKATDPTKSYIVQAPAGSGKTEILTQRFLNLLSKVSNPEQIIALTFTRKAANEMRERVIIALENVVNNNKPTSEHQKETHDFATAALLRDKNLQWNILQQPSRLRIITIDSLCQTIANALPLQENQTPYAKVSDNSRETYLQAGQNCIRFAATNDDYSPALKNILSHLDNRQDNLLDLFCNLLANREQWLSSLYQARLQDKEVFEDAIQWIEKHELQRFQKTIPVTLAAELLVLIKKLNLALPDTEEEISEWESFDQINSNLANKLSTILLTSQNKLRKSFDHHIGLKRGVCDDITFKDLKDKSKSILAELSELPDFLSAILRVKNLPDPQYDPQQWEILQSLFVLLPLLAAHLNILFNENNAVDFTAISHQALMALGEDEDPTNLALYLDNKIHHILVDEFQDTSIQQFQLLNQLVQGWEVGDGRTLFIVGDPMQSIYRFRGAEVGLFLRVREHGLGPVKLIPLELACNFRSCSTIVDWINLHFQNIFPKIDDIGSGAITYSKSSSTRASNSACYIKALQFASSQDEAQGLIGLALDELKNHPEDNVAILAKSRRQLTEIMRVIREMKIPFQGVDIDLLANLPHIRDIYSLTEALLMPANRLAWLSFLRSPWCGLSLEDLHLIANFCKSKSIYFALSKSSEIVNLSKDGRSRALFIHSILDNALKNRHQESISEWLLKTLNKLHINKILNQDEQDDLEQYWMLIDKFEKDGEISNWLLFKEQLYVLYSKNASTARLQIMTIHKSKGLEFDCVIIPGLGSKSANQDINLLRWLTLPTDENNEVLLVSPVKASHEESCSLYNYLGKIDNEKSLYELQRLLYVATTRAKKRLYLSDNKESISQGSFRHLLSQQEFSNCEDASNKNSEMSDEFALLHLPIEFYEQQSKYHDPYINNNDTYNMITSSPRLIGIIAHELLQWICNNHPEGINQIPWDIAEKQLISKGFSNENLKTAMNQLEVQIQNLWHDPIGQWLINTHPHEKNEYEVLITIENKIATRIIDRTFYYKGTRWIIDFKTGKDDIDTEKKHRKQLNEYAFLFSKNDSNIKCGLYYLSNNHWVEWEYSHTTKPAEIV